jgi:mannose-6-phosphate isomerase-like protein (cupin superfamily)
MNDVTVKRLDELDSYDGKGQFIYAGKSLGVSAWGMNVLKLPPSWQDYPTHDHAEDDHEEVYVVLSGHATLVTEGQSWQLKPDMIVRVGPRQKRKIVPGTDGVTLLALGGTPGKPYTPSRGSQA